MFPCSGGASGAAFFVRSAIVSGEAPRDGAHLWTKGGAGPRCRSQSLECLAQGYVAIEVVAPMITDPFQALSLDQPFQATKHVVALGAGAVLRLLKIQPTDKEKCGRLPRVFIPFPLGLEEGDALHLYRSHAQPFMS